MVPSASSCIMNTCFYTLPIRHGNYNFLMRDRGMYEDSIKHKAIWKESNEPSIILVLLSHVFSMAIKAVGMLSLLLL